MSKKLHDDWMNPPTQAWTAPSRRNDGPVWLIQRQKRRIVFGDPGSVTSWEIWAEYEVKEDRDAELKRLRETTSWSLRGRRGYYSYGSLRIIEPMVDE